MEKGHFLIVTQQIIIKQCTSFVIYALNYNGIF